MANEIPCAARLTDYDRQMASLLKATRPVAGGAKTSLFIAFLFKISKTPQLPDLPIEKKYFAIAQMHHNSNQILLLRHPQLS